jgi:hypothetical protein
MMRVEPVLNIDVAVADPELLGEALGRLDSWRTWLVVLKAAFGLPLNNEERRTFADVAGNRVPPGRRVRELWVEAGRRSGKSRMAALISCFFAVFVDHRPRLAPGEVGVVLILAPSKAQAAIIFNYCRAFFESSPSLRKLMDEVTADEIRLHGNIVLAIHSSSYKTVRGRTLLSCCLDEIAFFRDETSSNPDVETYRAILPALATTGGMLVAISTPYAQRGLLYQKHQASFGKDDPDVLVIRAGTTTLNPTIDLATIAAAQAEDPEAARAEWDAQFRGDLSTYIDRKVLEQLVEQYVTERSFELAHWYYAYADSSGGQHDSFAVAIAHRDGVRSVLDVAREWRAPFSPPEVVEDACKLLRQYKCTSISGDQYAARWVSDSFRLHGVSYRPSSRNRSETFLELLPLLTGGSVLLLDQPRLIGQFAQLERRVGRSGRDAVDHMRSQHDDLCLAAAGALLGAWETRRDPTARRRKEYPSSYETDHMAIKKHYGWGLSR